jgi:AraC-like DNA-binding protein
MLPGNRKVFRGAASLMPGVRQVGWAIFPKAKSRGLIRHRHPAHHEICYIVHGDLEWWVEKEVYRVSGGHVFVTRPGEIHGGINAVMNPCELYWVQIAISPHAPLPGLSPEDMSSLTSAFAGMQTRSFPGSADVKRCFDQWLAEVRWPRPYSAGIVRAAAGALLITVVRDYLASDRARANAVCRSERIQAVLDWIEESIAQVHTVETLARYAGMSATQLRRRFVEETGFAPVEYLTLRRIQRAKKLLVEGDHSVTRITGELGFSSSQYFATVFRNLTGLAPLQYRARTQR